VDVIRQQHFLYFRVLFNLRISRQHALQEVSIGIGASVADFTGQVQVRKEIRQRHVTLCHTITYVPPTTSIRTCLIRSTFFFILFYLRLSNSKLPKFDNSQVGYGCIIMDSPITAIEAIIIINNHPFTFPSAGFQSLGYLWDPLPDYTLDRPIEYFKSQLAFRGYSPSGQHFAALKNRLRNADTSTMYGGVFEEGKRMKQLWEQKVLLEARRRGELRRRDSRRHEDGAGE
jgi:hypothetical protein